MRRPNAAKGMSFGPDFISIKADVLRSHLSVSYVFFLLIPNSDGLIQRGYLLVFPKSQPSSFCVEVSYCFRYAGNIKIYVFSSLGLFFLRHILSVYIEKMECQ